MESLGAAIRSARMAAHMRPEHLAIAIDRSVYSINEYETGRVTPPLQVLVRISRALGVPLDQLMIEGEHPAHV